MSHIIDSAFFGSAFSTPEVRDIFSDDARLQRWLDVEAALARAQGRLGVLPAEAAEEITRHARLECLDRELLHREMIRTGHSLIPLLRALQAACADDFGQWIHYGATTQDIQDTGTVLAMARVLDIIERDTLTLIEVLLVLAQEHRDTIMVGRTHGQWALPTVFGYRLAVWACEFIRHIERIRAARPRLLVVSLFGGVGTMSALPNALETLELVARELNLNAPLTSWHASRDRIAEFVWLFSLVVSTCCTVANMVYELSKSEIGELAEGHQPHILCSSTMPHKQNPESSEQVAMIARMAKYITAQALESMSPEHERDGRAWRMEWVYIPEIACYAASCVATVITIMRGLRVDREVMRARVAAGTEYLSSERVMMGLAERLGKQRAHELLCAVIRRTREDGGVLLDELMAQEPVRAHFDRQTIESWLDPCHSLGQARALTDRAIEVSRAWLVDIRA